jgi:cytochrome c553
LRVRLFPAVLILATAAAACTPATNHTGDAFTADGEIIALSGGEGGPANACFSCHGLDGMGDGVSVPRLAGLDAGYLQKQLEDYGSETRADKVMGPIARWLDDGDRRAVAVWYAALPPAGGGGAATPAPAIYLNGAPNRGVAACASCHGAIGQGVGRGNPVIAGQPAAYALEQLRRWKTAERRNDPRGVMADAVAGLTEAEMRTIAAWLETLPTAPPPASDAASASAAAAAAARPEASRGTRRPGR